MAQETKYTSQIFTPYSHIKILISPRVPINMLFFLHSRFPASGTLHPLEKYQKILILAFWGKAQTVYSALSHQITVFPRFSL